MSEFDRRQFLKGGAAALVGVTGAGLAAPQDAAPRPPMAQREGDDGGPYQPQALAPDDMTLMSAIIDRLIPADALSPSASELGVAVYIDRQLAGPYGSGARWYMQGPFREGLPTQGYQASRTPAALVRDGLRAFAQQLQAQGEPPFDALDADRQDALLRQLESGDVQLDGVDAKTFFSQLLQLTKEGFLADPMYGGNRNMAGWKMIGFPGARANYYAWPEHTDQPYPYPPVSIMGDQG